MRTRTIRSSRSRAAVVGSLFLCLSSPFALPADSRRTDSQIASEIHATNELEMKLGQLARSKGTERAIRGYGDRLARDHAMADRMILDLANRQDLKITASSVTAEEKADTRQLEQAAGPAFDRAFAQLAKKGHSDVIRTLRRARAEAQSPALKELVSRLLPILKQHEQVARHLGATEREDVG